MKFPHIVALTSQYFLRHRDLRHLQPTLWARESTSVDCADEVALANLESKACGFRSRMTRMAFLRRSSCDLLFAQE